MSHAPALPLRGSGAAHDGAVSDQQPPDVPNHTARQYVTLGACGGFLFVFLVLVAGAGSWEPVALAGLLLGSFGGACHFAVVYLDGRN